MATLELTITPEYVDWGVWESIREIAQNAADARDQGHKMKVDYTEGNGVRIGGEYLKGTLSFLNDGVSITRETLLLGGTTKKDNHLARGQFGEGMKLAWASLLRMGCRVWMRTGGERWVPELAHSSQFNAELLKVKTATTKDFNDICVQIQGVSPEDWELVQDRLLFLRRPEEEDFISTAHGRILTADKYKGKLYVKEIYVCELPDRYHYGYDLRNVKIDRDRKLADPWSLKMAIRDVLMDAVQKDMLPTEEIMEVLDDQGCGESKVFDSEHYFTKMEFHERVAKVFVDHHGPDAAPVKSVEESIEAKDHGLKGIVVTEPLRRVVEHGLGRFEDRKVSRATDSQRTFSLMDLEDDESENLKRALGLVADHEENVGPHSVGIVEFYGEDVQGCFDQGGVIRIARRILKQPGTLVTVLASELARRYGPNGTPDHRDAVNRILGGIIEQSCFRPPGTVVIG